MLATLTNARFSVPENPVMRAVLAGMGIMQPGNGYAMGQSVDMYTQPSPASLAGADPTQIITQSGQLIWSGPATPSSGSDGTPYTAAYCDSIITGGTASDVDKFQCSLRGYVGAAPVYAIPPALVPDPPTSVTIPTAVARVNAPKAPQRPAQQSCQSSQQSDMLNDPLFWALALVAGYLIGKELL